MMADQQNLGPVKAWQIREFPEELRKEIVAEAERQGVPVSEFMTAQMAALQSAGWVATNLKLFATGKTGANLAALREIAEIARTLAPPGETLPKGITGAVNAILRRELKQMRGPKQTALPSE